MKAKSKFTIREDQRGYYDKDGCIPGIENGRWVATGPVQYTVVGPRGGIKATFPTKRKAQAYIKALEGK